jgi:3'-phosphoadenosine 5'-phosphosulfate sulfotransferase (PAPS reductase)/FAD synthetase
MSEPKAIHEVDPLHPDLEVPTPLDLVMRLTRPQREQRVERLIEIAWQRYHEAVNTHITSAGKIHHSTALLFSGGKDSSTIATIFRPVLTHVIHADTGTGIEATRQFVRDTALEWGIPLIMERGVDDYWNVVRGMIRNKTNDERPQPPGFPGPGAHSFFYARLKERALDQARHTMGIARSRSKRSVWIAGRRRSESQRRSTIPHHESDGTVVWCSPIAVWHKADLLTLRLMRDDVPINPVSEKLGMSGECGCLCNASPGEREMWFSQYPDEPFLRRVLEVEAELADRDDIPEDRKRWGWAGERDDESERQEAGRLCGPDCGVDPLLAMMDPLRHA